MDISGLLFNVFSISLLILGFGFVIFWHELGHFLAAKYVGIRVEQFAVGFGHAICAWRKGIGLRWGSTQAEHAAALEKDPRAAAALGETEYRLNWIPLGGYVKMLGQDDLNPSATADDPRAFNRKSIPARMLVVSAGVIMNVILAAIGFMLLFLIGYNVPPPVVGAMQTGSPFQKAGGRIGDRIEYLDGTYIHDYNKLHLNAALVRSDRAVELIVHRADGSYATLEVWPQRPDDDHKSFLMLGVMPTVNLRGLDEKFAGKVKNADGSDLDPARQLLPGDVITHVDGKPVGIGDYPVLDAAVQDFGRPVELTVRGVDGTDRKISVRPQFEAFFGEDSLNIAGLQPPARVDGLQPNSVVKDKLRDGDLIVAVKVGEETRQYPTAGEFVRMVTQAGAAGTPVQITIRRDGKEFTYSDILPTARLEKGKRGLGVGVSMAEDAPVVVAVVPGSPAAVAGIPAKSTITAIDGQPVTSWFDVHRLLSASAGEHAIALRLEDGRDETRPMKLAQADWEKVRGVRYRPDVSDLVLQERIEQRRTANPIKAAAWGVTETRDLLLQFYVTLHRLVTGEVSYTNLMGPIGIVYSGSYFAMKGFDWLLWFLAMISANLAVVNFLPIPIVDGGLFTFLIIEKIQGKPLSARTQTIAQVVGLAILLSVFLLVTYQDIARFL